MQKQCTFLQIPQCVMKHCTKLSGLQLAILADAWTWDNQGKAARRSNETLAQMFGASARAIIKSVKRLEQLGLVQLSYGANNIRHIKPQAIENLNECSPRTIVHPEQMFTPPLNHRSPQHGTTVHPPPEPSFTQVYQRVNQGVKPREEQELPFGDSFASKWAEWIDERKQRKIRKYTPRGHKAALKQLAEISNYDEKTAIAIIDQSIAKGWQGLFAIKTPQARNNGQRASASVTADQFAELVTKRY